MNIKELYKIIITRKKERKKNSYTASLVAKGTDRVIQKIGEEAIEVVIAAKNKKKRALIEEVADLVFHLLVMLSIFGITPQDIEKELEKRNTRFSPQN